MGMLQKKKWCRTCERYRLYTKDDRAGKISFPAGCLITVVTCGIALPFEVLANFGIALQPYRCSSCGSS